MDCNYLVFILGCLFSVVSSTSQNSMVESFTERWAIEGNSTLMNTKFLAANKYSYVFANCSATKNCDITIKNSNHKKTCSLQLLADPNRVLQLDPSRLTPKIFGHGKVIISHRERTVSDMFQVITLTDMSTCHSTYVTYKHERTPHLLLTNVVVNENTFDVIVGGERACAGLEWCRVTYDQQGRRLGRPSPFETSLVIFQTEAVGNEGFYLFGLTDRPFKLMASYVDTSGAETILTQADLFDPYGAPRAFSSAHELLGVCWYNSSYPQDPNVLTMCKQFDVRGRLVVDTTVANLGTVADIAVHNLENGGMLVVTSEGFDSSKVTGIHRDGRIHEIQLDLPARPVDLITEDEGEFCFHFTKRSGLKKGLLSYLRKCVLKNVVYGE